MIDYSAPNVAKQMHVGHLRSTIIGDCFNRVLTGLGHRVIAQNHIGDWGTQFGMLVEQILDERHRRLGADLPEAEALYKRANAHFRPIEEFAEPGPATGRRLCSPVTSRHASDLAAADRASRWPGSTPRTPG